MAWRGIDRASAKSAVIAARRAGLTLVRAAAAAGLHPRHGVPVAGRRPGVRPGPPHSGPGGRPGAVRGPHRRPPDPAAPPRTAGPKTLRPGPPEVSRVRVA